MSTVLLLFSNFFHEMYLHFDSGSLQSIPLNVHIGHVLFYAENLVGDSVRVMGLNPSFCGRPPLQHSLSQVAQVTLGLEVDCGTRLLDIRFEGTKEASKEGSGTKLVTPNGLESSVYLLPTMYTGRAINRQRSDF